MGERGGKQKSGVLICGAYGMRNAGDEAVLDAILAELRGIDPEMEITVLSRSPEETQARHGVRAIHSFGLRGVLRAMRSSALYVNGGGSLIQDVTSSRSLWYYLYTLAAAKRRGCRVMMYGCGVGPVGRPFNRKISGRIIDRYVDAVTLRSGHDLDALRALGVTRPEVTLATDPALSLPGAPAAETDALLRACGADPDKRYLCICVRRWPGVREKLPLFAAAAAYAREAHGLTPLILAVNRQEDVAAARELRELIAGESLLITEEMSTGQVVGLISRMEAVLSMRLHPLIFSASHSVPAAGVSYDPKVAAFLDDIGQTNYIAFDALTAPEQLTALIDAAACTSREALRRSAARLLSLERRNAETAEKLLRQQA